MPGKLPYTMTETFPFIPMDVVRKRLEKKSRMEGDCRIWIGCRRRARNRRERAGYLRIKSPTGENLVFAHRLAWWIEKGRYPGDEYYLRHVCGNPLCTTVAHLEPMHVRESRKLTREQVIEARNLFWRPYMKLTKQQLKMKPMTAERMAAWALKMRVETVERVMRGQPVWPKMWRGNARTEEQVKAAVAAHQPAAAKYRKEHDAAWSMPELADRFRIRLSMMLGIVNGTLYGDIPMPDEARIRLQRQGQEKFKEEVMPPKPKILEDGSFDYSRPSDWSVRLEKLKKKPPASQKLGGAMDYIMN